MITMRIRPWKSILQHYRSLADYKWKIAPMIDLVKHIHQTYSNKLFASTSLDRLIISIYEEIDMGSEALHIWYDQVANQFHFSYFGGHSRAEQPEWERKYQAQNGVEKFDQFVKMINW